MEKYIPRFTSISNGSYFLFGPRGTGKSTFLKNNFPDALYVDLLKPDQFRIYSAKPERIIDIVEGEKEKKIVIIDEVQKLPEILSAVHYLIESKKNVKFILTGSSTRKLKKSGTNLLAGRVLKKSMHPFLYSEVLGYFSFGELFNFGSVPIVLASENKEEVLNSYVSLYIQEEVQQEGFVRKIGDFNRFLESISFSHGQLLNISNIARDCHVERKVVEGYIKILEDILIAKRINVFSKKAKRHLIQHPKFYFFDTGVYRTLRPKGPFDRPEEINGSALEGFVFQNLLAWNEYRKEKFDINFWRTRRGLEVDFVLYGREGVFPIEVKNTNKIRREDLKSLRTFLSDYNIDGGTLLYMGAEKLFIDNVQILPVKEFLKKLIPAKNISEIFLR